MSLADLVPRRTPLNPTWPPSPMTDPTTGLQFAWTQCAKCGEWYQLTRSPRLGLIAAGECSCAVRERKARALLSTRSAERQRRIDALLDTWKQSIGEAIEDQVAVELEALRTRVEEKVRWEYEQKAAGVAGEQMLRDLIAELKAKAEN